MLPTGDPLGTVVTMLATPFGRLDGLAIDLPAWGLAADRLAAGLDVGRASLMAFQVPSRFHAQSSCRRSSMGENRGATLSRYSIGLR